MSGVVVGSVLEMELLTGFKKEIRYGRVDVGGRVHEVVCGAPNVAAGQRVPVQVGDRSIGGVDDRQRGAGGLDEQ